MNDSLEKAVDAVEQAGQIVSGMAVLWPCLVNRRGGLLSKSTKGILVKRLGLSQVSRSWEKSQELAEVSVNV